MDFRLAGYLLPIVGWQTTPFDLSRVLTCVTLVQARNRAAAVLPRLTASLADRSVISVIGRLLRRRDRCQSPTSFHNVTID